MEIEAAVLRSPDAPFTVEQVELPDPGPRQVLVEVRGVGFCHTDLLPRTPGFMASPPIIVGHEAAGVVRAVGPGITGVEPDSHVLLTFDSYGACSSCAGGHPAYCSTFFARNLSGTGIEGSPVRDAHGEAVAARWFGQSSFAGYALATARNVVAVDRRLPLHLLGPLSCSVQTGAGSILNSLHVRAGASVVVIGAGSVGLAAIMAARVAGAATITAV